MDFFIYSGPIERGNDLKFIRMVHEKKKSESAVLVLTTGGGSPDAAYKIGRYLQSRFETLQIFIPGICKSAGTLLAMAGSELVFSPYGELGPLDIQMSKQDNLAGMESGLNISEALASVEDRAQETYHRVIAEIIGGSSGIVSFQTASHSAAEIVGSLYSPMFSQIDPEEVGSRARAMRIGESYGKRLNTKFNNLKLNAIEIISQSYPSHGFVIDLQEAQLLFNNVREATDTEKELIRNFGDSCRFPQNDLYLDYVFYEETSTEEDIPNENHNGGTQKQKGTKRKTGNARDPEGAGQGERT